MTFFFETFLNFSVSTQITGEGLSYSTARARKEIKWQVQQIQGYQSQLAG